MNRSAFTQFGLALLFALLAGLLYGWWYVQVTTEIAQSEALAAEAQMLGEEFSRSALARTELAALAVDEAFVAGRFLPVPEIVEFLEELETTGRSFGAQVSVVSVADATTKGRLSVALSIAGSFDAVMRTIGAVEYGRYASVVRNLTLDTAGEGEWSASMTMEVEAATAPTI